MLLFKDVLNLNVNGVVASKVAVPVPLIDRIDADCLLGSVNLVVYE